MPSIIGIRRCSALYWLGFAISLPIFIVIAIFISRYLVHNCEMKIQLGYSFEVCHDCTITELNRKRQTSISYFIATNSTLMWQEGDIIWTYNKTALIGIISFLAGILAALLGIGGGLIISPILVHLSKETSFWVEFHLPFFSDSRLTERECFFYWSTAWIGSTTRCYCSDFEFYDPLYSIWFNHSICYCWWLLTLTLLFFW